MKPSKVLKSSWNTSEEDQTSDAREPMFKEAALCLYRALPEGVKKKRMQIWKRKLQISDVKSQK